MTTTKIPDPTLGTTSPAESWGDLPESEPVILPTAPEQTPDKVPGTGPTCQACGEEIVRRPGSRGRMPKFHPDCRPKGATASIRNERVGKAQSEADEIIVTVRGALMKFAIMVAIVDRYDAFVIMVNSKSLADNLRATLIRYPNIRKQLLDAKGTGSLFGLAATFLMTVLPIAAHHGLLPFKTLAPILINAPKSLYAIQQKLEQGEASLIEVMQDQMKAANGTSKVRENG